MRTTFRAFAVVAVLAGGALAGGGNAPFISSTYLGGTRDDIPAAVAIGPDGMLWIAGSTASLDWPGAERGDVGIRRTDVVVLRVDRTSREVLSSVYLGGSSFETVTAIAFDAQGTGYVAGLTRSPDFPGHTHTPNPNLNDYDVFVARLTPGAWGFEWSYSFGGSGFDYAGGLCVLPNGDPVVVGSTESPDFPSVGQVVGGPVTNSRGDAFTARIKSSGLEMEFCTRFGGSSDDEITAAAALPSGNVVVAGRTLSFDFPTSDPPQRFSSESWTGFVTEIDPSGKPTLRSRVYRDTWFTSILAEPGGSVVCAGESGDAGLDVARFRHMRQAPFHDAVVVRLGAEAFDVEEGTFFGGTASEFGSRLARAADGTIWLAGTTYSADLPLPNLPPGVPSATEDLFIASLDPADFHLISGAQIGSPERDTAPSVAADDDGTGWLLGMTMSDEFPLVDPVGSLAAGLSGYDLVLARFDSEPPVRRPRAPRNLEVRPGQGRAVELTWEAADSLATSYVIDRAEFQDFEPIDIVPGGTTKWTDHFTLPDRGYSYTVRAVGAGGGSPLSDEIRAVVPASVDVVVTSGVLKGSRRRFDTSLFLEGTIRPSGTGGTPPDIVRFGASMVFFADVGNVEALYIFPGDPLWRTAGKFLSWKSGGTRFEFNPATGAFRLRVKRQTLFAGPQTSVTMQFLSGNDAGSTTNTWHLDGRTRLRTP